MILAKDLKRIVNQIPDNAPVCIGESCDCDITGYSFDTSDGIVRLKLTEDYGLVRKSFIDSFFNDLKKAYEIGR